MNSEFVLSARAAVLEIGAPGAADQQRVAGEHAVAQHEAVGIVGVAGGVEHVEAQAFDLQLVAFGETHGDDIDARPLAHHGDALGAVAQRAQPGNVVGVQMRVDRLDQPQVEFLHKLEVAIDLLQHRVDDQRLAAAAAGEQIAVGRRDAVEQLTKDHAASIETKLHPDGRQGEDTLPAPGKVELN